MSEKDIGLYLNHQETTTPPPPQQTNFMLVYANAQEMRDIFKALYTLNTEVTFNFSNEGLKTRFMDCSHVAMMKLNLSKNGFDDYEINKPFKVCFNLEDLIKKVFRNTGKNDRLKLTIKDTAEGAKEGAAFTLLSDIARRFKMATLEEVNEEIPAPKISYKVTVKIALTVLTRIMKDLNNIADYLIFRGDKETVTFSATLNDYTKETYNVTVDKSNENLLSYYNLAGDTQQATFSLNYLKEIIKALKPLTDVIEISFSHDMPLQLSIDFNNYGNMLYWLAPRIEHT